MSGTRKRKFAFDDDEPRQIDIVCEGGEVTVSINGITDFTMSNRAGAGVNFYGANNNIRVVQINQVQSGQQILPVNLNVVKRARFSQIPTANLPGITVPECTELMNAEIAQLVKNSLLGLEMAEANPGDVLLHSTGIDLARRSVLHYATNQAKERYARQLPLPEYDEEVKAEFVSRGYWEILPPAILPAAPQGQPPAAPPAAPPGQAPAAPPAAPLGQPQAAPPAALPGQPPATPPGQPPVAQTQRTRNVTRRGGHNPHLPNNRVHQESHAIRRSGRHNTTRD